MNIGGPSPINTLIASSFGNPDNAAAIRAAQSQANIQADARAVAAKAGPGANVTISYDYEVGPDGQLVATGATIQTSRRTSEAPNSLTNIEDAQGSPSQPILLFNNGPRSFADLANPRPALSPSDEAVVFGSEEFLEDTLNTNEAARRARLQIADFGVRAQERQHFFAASGFGSAPQYEYEIGPDGELYAVAGSVAISTPATSDPERAARNAATVANAALAATDVSAQDISVARDAQARVASLYAQNNDTIEQEVPISSVQI